MLLFNYIVFIETTIMTVCYGLCLTMWLYLAEAIGLPYPPPYLAPTTKGPSILTGVNFASAASGILRSTGFNFVSME